MILKLSLIFSVIGFIIMMSLLLLLRRHTETWSVLLDTHGSSGWNVRVAWILGLINSMYMYSSTDSAIHIAEEMKSPAKQLPQVLNMTLAMGFVTTFPLILVMMLSMTDASAVLNSTLPYGELFYQITSSTAVTTLVLCWVAFSLYTALIGQWVGTGRLLWAFARDGGLPYSSFFARVNQTYGFPVRTTVLTLVFCCVYGLLYLISTVAFNSILGSAVLFSNITYCIPGAIVAIRGRSHILPEHPFNLGFIGRVCNALSPIIVLALGVLACLPPELPVTSSNVNYTPVVLVIAYLSIWVSWYVIGKNFEGPQIDWDVLKNTKVI